MNTTKYYEMAAWQSGRCWRDKNGATVDCWDDMVMTMRGRSQRGVLQKLAYVSQENHHHNKNTHPPHPHAPTKCMNRVTL